jgi:hypothetical protein
MGGEVMGIKDGKFDIRTYTSKKFGQVTEVRGRTEDMTDIVLLAERLNGDSKIDSMKDWLNQQTVDGIAMEWITAILLDWADKRIKVIRKNLSSAIGLQGDSIQRLLVLLKQDGWLNEDGTLNKGAVSRLEKHRRNKS